MATKNAYPLDWYGAAAEKQYMGLTDNLSRLSLGLHEIFSASCLR